MPSLHAGHRSRCPEDSLRPSSFFDPNPLRWALDRSGDRFSPTFWFSVRIMQVTEVFVYIVVLLPNSTIFSKTAFALLPSVALLLLPFPLFSFQGANPRSKTGSKRSKTFKRFDPFSGGDKRDRTADLLRAKQALSHLSYTPIGNWWALVGSNHRPYDYQSYALAS